ncbi:MAG: anti-virulence regulator CigR family protein [Xanthomonadales bacterium]|nr:anti-virulence regulator CigR family protein [Xanthomonadales bacterium]
MSIAKMPRTTRTARPVLLFLLVGLFLGTNLAAEPPQDRPGSPPAGRPDRDAGPSRAKQERAESGYKLRISAGITTGEARQLAAQHGVTGHKPLPPGIRKNLARGKPLPPGIQKTRMPDEFVGQLPYHEGYEWRRAGSDLALVATDSLVVADLLENVFD